MEPTYLGYAAGALTVLSYAPQVVRAYRTKEVKDLSWAMVALLVTAGALWIVYGISSGQMPVILTNVGTTLLTGALLVAKFRYRAR
jgi:MtN3 and saliva related transmembrane protein